MFFVHTTLEKFENATINGYFGFVFEGKLGQRKKSHANRDVIVFRKTSFSKSFFLPKTKTGVFRVHCGPNRRNKAAFPNSLRCA